MNYKDASPDVTVNRIRTLLEKVGVRTREVLYENQGLSYSNRISLDNPGFETLDIGTNGKGMSYDFSMASGYAELMERMQNKFLVNEAMRYANLLSDTYSLPFRFYPDEQLNTCSSSEFREVVKKIFPKYKSSQIEDDLQVEWLSVPFACVSANQTTIEQVPIVLARANTSTGMCAGNTPAEAILQGINEIFERYVLQRIYIDEITPPSYPKDYFNGTKIELRLKQLEQMGYIYDVKDMSLGIGLPVVGLILTNLSNGTTMCRLGADLSEEIALERCFTEIFQGRTDTEMRFIDYSLEVNLNDAERRTSEYKKTLKNGTGYMPLAFFGGEPTYSFTPFQLKRTGDTKQDLHNVVQYIHNLGCTLYVRDNSFLDFCTYHVIVSGLTEQDPILWDVMKDYKNAWQCTKKENCTIVSDMNSTVVWPMYNLKAQHDLRGFIRNNYPNDDTLRLAPYCSAPQNYINKYLLLFLFAIKNEDYADAVGYFNDFMQQREEQGYGYNAYLSCVKVYVQMKAKGLETNMHAYLSHFYDEDTIHEVLADFSNPMDIMKNYSFPTCFNCSACPLQDNCHFVHVIQFEQLLQNCQINNPIDQTKLFDVLH